MTEIGDSLGFYDPAGLGRIFKKVTANTPTGSKVIPTSNLLPKKARKAERTS
jgi:hypothetical protein